MRAKNEDYIITAAVYYWLIHYNLLAAAVAVADAQYELPKAMTVLATSGPHAPLEQSRSPYLKLTLPHRQAASCALAHPSGPYWASMLLKHSWPHDGRAATPVAVDVAGAVAAAVPARLQRALPYAMVLLAAATSAPHAPLLQSRTP